jgi:hypothetical protein
MAKFGEVPQPSEWSRERNAIDLQPGQAMRKNNLEEFENVLGKKAHLKAR